MHAMRDFPGKRWCEPMDDPDTTDASILTPLRVFYDARLLYWFNVTIRLLVCTWILVLSQNSPFRINDTHNKQQNIYKNIHITYIHNILCFTPNYLTCPICIFSYRIAALFSQTSFVDRINKNTPLHKM